MLKTKKGVTTHQHLPSARADRRGAAQITSKTPGPPRAETPARSPYSRNQRSLYFPMNQHVRGWYCLTANALTHRLVPKHGSVTSASRRILNLQDNEALSGLAQVNSCGPEGSGRGSQRTSPRSTRDLLANNELDVSSRLDDELTRRRSTGTFPSTAPP